MPAAGGRLRRAGAMVAALVVATILLSAVHNWSALLATLPLGPLAGVATLRGSELATRLVLLACAVAVLIWLAGQIVRRVRALALPYLGLARAQALGTFTAVAVYALIILFVAWAAGIELSGLALPGALTGVIIGITAQASLGNLINGLVILFTRPYVEGMSITARSPGLAGSEYSGTVTNIGLFYTTMRVAGREVRLPNSAMAQSTVIVRPADLELYIPLVLQPGADYAAATTAVRGALLHALPPHSAFALVLERVDATGFTVGVHASLSSLADQETLTTALAPAVAPYIIAPPPAASPPAPAPADEVPDAHLRSR